MSGVSVDLTANYFDGPNAMIVFFFFVILCVIIYPALSVVELIELCENFEILRVLLYQPPMPPSTYLHIFVC